MIGKKELEELERLAKNATPGPWETKLIDNPYYFGGRPLWELTVDGCFVGESPNDVDAAYIVAACNAVSELITENLKFKKQNDFFLKALKENFMCPYSRCKYDDGSELQEWECDAENNRECWIKAAKEA